MGGSRADCRLTSSVIAYHLTRCTSPSSEILQLTTLRIGKKDSRISRRAHMNMRPQTMRAVHARGPRSRTLILRDELEVVDLLERGESNEDHEKTSRESRERGGKVEEDVLRRAPGRVHALATPSEPRT